MKKKESKEKQTFRVAGCDLGKSAAKFVIASFDSQGTLLSIQSEIDSHGGDPLAAFRSWYSRAQVSACAALGSTGICADELIEPVIHGLPIDACLEKAVAYQLPAEGALNVIRVGARGYSVLVRDRQGQIQSIQNDKCSSGTGETMVKIAARFGLSIQEADALAGKAKQSIPITARCSVFAKSEMTHFGNQGRPAAELFRGYFTSVAVYVAALLARVRVDGPVFLIGGGTHIKSLVAALSTAIGETIQIPAQAQIFEAIGAAALAAELVAAGESFALPEDPDRLLCARQQRFLSLAPARASAHRVKRLSEPKPAPGAAQTPTLLGLDLGSTGSKATLTSIESGEAVLHVYDRTRGNPVQATQRLIEAILAQTKPDVRAIGITGSGREAVATVLRAVYGENNHQLTVYNEIVAHATAAIRCDPDHGQSLSVVEIGGQDAKFIQISGGQIVESDMNKACSAGTGSFLEEQAIFYGIEDIEEFARLAEQAEGPPELGQMCTVHVAEAAGDAANEGFSLPELFSGFQYSVIQNYLNRVMGQRTFAQRIFFQGKPASSASLAWTLAATADREVMVPANPGAMGAWGIGLCTRDELGVEALAAAKSLDLALVLRARIVKRGEFRCHDRKCATLCHIEKTTVKIGSRQKTVYAGGACPKYEISTATKPKLDREAPSAFAERDALMAPFLADQDGAEIIGLPVAGAMFGYLPWFSTLLRELGFGVRILRSDSQSLARGEECCYSFDACAPIKIAHGLLPADLQTVFLPKLLKLGDRDGSQGLTCPMEQGLPEMIRDSAGARGLPTKFLSPCLELDGDLASKQLRKQLQTVFRPWRKSDFRIHRALRAAATAQHQYQNQLAQVGERCLAYGRKAGIPTVVVCGNQHVIHDRAINAGIPALLRENGVLALPMECYPIPAATPALPRIYWAETNRALRTALSARARGDVYPLMLTAFGCGPASFNEQVLIGLMEGYPHTVLETDGHGGNAGYVTRVQAFLHTVRKHERQASSAPEPLLQILEPLRPPPLKNPREQKIVVLSFEDLAPMLTQAFRAYGLDASAAAPASAELLAVGRRDCSGKECLPYQIIWGAFRQHLQDHPTDLETVLLQVTGEGRCRTCMYSIKDQMTLERMGLRHKVSLRHFGPESQLGPLFFARIWAGTLLWDLLNQMLAYYRPFESTAGQADDLYQSLWQEAADLVGRPTGPGLSAAVSSVIDGREYLGFVDRIGRAFARLARDAKIDPRWRTVLVTGDIYVRLGRFTNDDLIRRLNQRGLKVLLEPAYTLTEYGAEVRVTELFGLPTRKVDNAVMKAIMMRMRRNIFKRMQRHHPWLPNIEIADVLSHSEEVLDRFPIGEAPVAIGSVLHHWHRRNCDGVVVANPWGCAPALVTESLLRHHREIPIHFYYADGAPMDERQLNAFAFRLQRLPQRVPASLGLPGAPVPEVAATPWARLLDRILNNS